MTIIGGPLSAWTGSGPPAYRLLVDIVRDIGTLLREEQVDALRKAPKAVRELCFLAYGPHELGLPDGPMEYEHISARAYETVSRIDGYYNGGGDSGDLLYDEAERRLVKLFAIGAGPAGLTNERRLELWKQTCARLSPREVELLDDIRIHRTIPGIMRQTVQEAFPGFLETARTPQKVEGIRYDAALWEPQPVAEAAGAPALKVTDAQKTLYDQVYSRLKFG